ncbi:MAG: hypothetical protein KG075_05515 [Alphaproteobacteria bacterium]|nr:hypothetical protein [Alphaproteobacteria bacterium]
MSSVPAKKKRTKRDYTLKRRAFWQLLGQFVWLFSFVESNVKDVLWQLTKMQPQTARAVLSGIKIDAAMSLIRRLSEAEDWPQKRRSEVEHVFRQLALINSFRNDILHKFWDVEGRKLTVSNVLSVHIPERIQETTVTMGDLKRMIADLTRINFSLLYFSLGEETRGYRSLLHRKPWLYKPPQTNGRRQKPPSNAQGRQPPRPTSRR